MTLKIVEAHYYQKESEVKMEVVRELKNDGIAKGLCRQWQMKLKDELDVADLSSLFIRGIDFCISENFPTLDYLRDNFKGKCEEYGIYIDDDEIAGENIPDMVLNGACKGALIYDGYSVSRIYARHGTALKVNVSENAILTIDAFDNSIIEINAIGLRAKVFVHLYGNASAKCSGDGIKVKKYNKLTY
jgi:hypothetical protein